MNRFIALLLVCFSIIAVSAKAQTVIQMEADGGVYRIPCVVNGLKLKLIFDTGASTVSLSSSVANMMLENDYLDRSDIRESGASQIANGQIIDHTRIILRKIEIGGLTLSNVEAVVIHQQEAPLLLGLSAINKLGKISINGNQLTINNAGPKVKNISKNYSRQELFNINGEAISLWANENYIAAVELFDILDYNNALDPIDVSLYADCLSHSNRHEEAFEKYLSIIEWTKINSKHDLGLIYFRLCEEAFFLNDYYSSIKYGGACQLNTSLLDYERFSVTKRIAWAHMKLGDITSAKNVCEQYLTSFFNVMDISATDCWTKEYKDPYVASIYYTISGFYDDEDSIKKYLLISAAWGYDSAIEDCNKYKLNYLKQPYEYRY